MFYQKLIILITVLSIISCVKDKDIFDVVDSPKYSTNLLGLVTDQDGKPLSGVKVTSGTKTIETDIYGVYHFIGLPVNALPNPIQIHKEGYFDHSSSFLVQKNGSLELRQTLFSKEFSIKGESSKPFEFSIPNVFELNIAENSFVTEIDNKDYYGPMKAAIQIFDYSKRQEPLHTIGGNLGITNNQEIFILSSLGQAMIEFLTIDGRKLKLKPGVRAKISLKVSSPISVRIPKNIPTWYFDSKLNFWKESGIAELIGDSYIVSVDNLNWINFSEGQAGIHLRGKITDKTGKPLNGLLLSFYDPSGVQLQNQISNSTDGSFNSFLPRNTIFKLKISQGQCPAETITELPVGPFFNDAQLDNIQIEIERGQATKSIIGEFLNCNGHPIEKGYLKLTIREQNFVTPIVNGKVNFQYINCNNEPNIRILAIDEQEKKEVLINNVNNLNAVNLGKVNICHNQNESITVRGFINAQFNNFEFGFIEAEKSVSIPKNSGKDIFELFKFNYNDRAPGLVKEGVFEITGGRVATLIPTVDTYEILHGGQVNVTSGGVKGSLIYVDYKFTMKSITTMKEVQISGNFKKTI